MSSTVQRILIYKSNTANSGGEIQFHEKNLIVQAIAHWIRTSPTVFDLMITREVTAQIPNLRIFKFLLLLGSEGSSYPASLEVPGAGQFEQGEGHGVGVEGNIGFPGVPNTDQMFQEDQVGTMF